MQDNQSQTHWAYMAGVMDSYGCFMISKHRRKTKNRSSSRAHEFPKRVDSWAFTYLPAIKIAMTDPEAIYFAMNDMQFGQMSIDGTRGNRKPLYHWRIREKNKAVEFLEGVMPYLKVKHKRALHILNFCNHIKKFKNPGYIGVSKEELEYREDTYLKMRELNGTKVGATTKS